MEQQDSVPSSPYYTDPVVHAKINELLHKAAALDAQIGKDNKNEPEGLEIREKIEHLYTEIEILDKEYYSVICPAND